MLFGAAGLLSHVKYPEEARRLRALLKHLPRTRTMSAEQWKLFRVRPANHPVIRITGAAHLVDRYLDVGLARGLADEVGRGDATLLLTRLTVRPFIGKGRAGDMVVNVVLPFLHAYAAIAQSSALRRSCVEVYHALPKLEDNEITREMKRLLHREADPPLEIRARRQQGLIHLYRWIMREARPHSLAVQAQERASHPTRLTPSECSGTPSSR